MVLSLELVYATQADLILSIAVGQYHDKEEARRVLHRGGP